MGLTATSLMGMPFLGIAKQRLADTLGSATHGEGTQNLLCAYLAGAVFLGLARERASGCGGSTRWRPWSSRRWRSRKAAQTWRGEGCCASLLIAVRFGVTFLGHIGDTRSQFANKNPRFTGVLESG